jgi:hypothetical protein
MPYVFSWTCCHLHGKNRPAEQHMISKLIEHLAHHAGCEGVCESESGHPSLDDIAPG